MLLLPQLPWKRLLLHLLTLLLLPLQMLPRLLPTLLQPQLLALLPLQIPPSLLPTLLQPQLLALLQLRSKAKQDFRGCQPCWYPGAKSPNLSKVRGFFVGDASTSACHLLIDPAR